MPTNSSKTRDREGRIAGDLKLVGEVISGSLRSWHLFLHQYSDLILQVVRRHLFAADEDDIRSVHVDVLKALYNGELAKYDDRSKLSTWLIVFTRSRSLDFFRKIHGRYRFPAGYRLLDDPDRRVLRLYYAENLPIEIVIQMLCWEGYDADADFLADSVQRIERLIDPRYLKRLGKRHLARSSGIGSVDALEYLVYLRHEQEQSTERNRPDAALLEKETDETMERLRELIKTLSDEDQKVIEFRFQRGWTAKRISRELSLGSQRRAYTLIDRAVRRLRDRLGWEPGNQRTT
jgi:DNA-directed RNA polymerase specialized sigma24 family protein